MLFNVKSTPHSKYKSQKVLYGKSKRTTKGGIVKDIFSEKRIEK